MIGLVVGAGVVGAVWAAFGIGFGRAAAEYVALIELSGNIAYSESPLAIFGETLNPEKVEELINRVEADPYAKAVVLVINSPGGSAAASEEIYRMLRDLADERTVVAYIAEYGASGGYYIALPAEKIVASPNALTGSVGAISMTINFAELMDHLGVEAEVFKSGRLKDAGNPFRPMTEEDRRLMQSLIDSIADVFQNRVREHRAGKVKDWEEVFTARPYTGVQALEAGLVDEVGTLQDAVEAARELAGLPEDTPTRWIRPRKPSLLELLLGGGEGGGLKLSYEALLMWPLPSLPEPYHITPLRCSTAG